MYYQNQRSDLISNSIFNVTAYLRTGLDRIRLKYDRGCFTMCFTYCDSTLPLLKSFASQSTMNGFVKFKSATLIVFANATEIVLKLLCHVDDH